MLSCTPFVASSLHAAAAPESARPHFTHAPDWCRLGGKLLIEKQWAGGTSFQASFVMALWRAGAVVTLDFWTPLGEGGRADVRQVGAQHATNAEALGGGGRPGTMRFRLSGEPNEHNGFNFIGHGGVIHVHPVITCSGLPACSWRERAVLGRYVWGRVPATARRQGGRQPRRRARQLAARTGGS